MPKRNLTVGVTVNLKNYESLRLDVQDEVESEEDVRSLVAFLDETLALFGRGNRETEDLVAHYRRRVMQGALGEGRGAARLPSPAAEKGGSAARRGSGKTDEPPAPEPVAAEPPVGGARRRSPHRKPPQSPRKRRPRRSRPHRRPGPSARSAARL